MRLYEDLTAEERIRELATILARGLHRLYSTPSHPTDSLPIIPAKKSQKSSQNCLESVSKTRLSGVDG